MKNKINGEQKRAIIKIMRSKIQKKIDDLRRTDDDRSTVQEKIFSNTPEGKKIMLAYVNATEAVKKVEETAEAMGFAIKNPYGEDKPCFRLNTYGDRNSKGAYYQAYKKACTDFDRKIKALEDFAERLPLSVYGEGIEADELVNQLTAKIESLAK